MTFKGFDNNELVVGSIQTTDPIDILYGGTGGSDKLTSFDNLSPTTSKGDLIVSDGGNNLRLPVGIDGYVLTADSAQSLGLKWSTVAGTGDVVGPGSSTDNAIARFSGVTGKLLQNSVATLSDAGALATASLTLTTDLAVADGGTGLSSATAFAVLCGGTTSTAAFQSIASVGTSGQVLTSNGAGALPTFQAAGGGSSPLTTKGDLYTYSTDDARLAVGTNNYQLVANSSETTGLEWVSTRQWRHESTTTISADSTIEFTGLTSALTKFIFVNMRWGDQFSNDRRMYIRISDDNGATWKAGASDYRYGFTGRMAGSGALGGNSAGDTEIQTGISSSITTDTGRSTYIEVYVMNADTSARNITIWGTGNGSDGETTSFSGIYNTAAAADGIQFFVSAGDFDDGNVYKYTVVEGA